MIRRPAVCFALLVLAGATPLSAQRRAATPQLDQAEPCCNIAAIDARTGIVTARVTATGKTFRFEVKDRALLAKLRVGGVVWADFTAGRVRVDPGEPCCGIVSETGAAAARNAVRPAEPVGRTASGKADPQEPCCNITAIDARTGIVTARVTGTNRTFRFEVKDAALLRSLTIGQRVFADFGKSQVRIHGIEPCCSIIGH